VFAPLTFDKNGEILNTNADTQASAIAVSLAACFEVNLIYCFEKKGVLLDASDDSSVITDLNPEKYTQFKEEGRIFEGMIPKLDNAFKAIEQGVKRVKVCHSDDLLKVINERQNLGTTLHS
jgi:acetylglutamate kinase